MVKLAPQVLADYDALVPKDDPTLRDRNGRLKGLKDDSYYSNRQYRHDKETPHTVATIDWIRLKREERDANDDAFAIPADPSDTLRELQVAVEEAWLDEQGTKLPDPDSRLFDLLLEGKWNQRDNAAALGVSQTWVSRHERKLIATLQATARVDLPTLCGPVVPLREPKKAVATEDPPESRSGPPKAHIATAAERREFGIDAWQRGERKAKKR
jgi:hypothetical protein